MPTYDYQCRECGNRIEVIHGMTENGPATCDVCGGPMRRVLHAAGIIFKGSGFYKTDSRSASSSSTPPASSPATSSSAASEAAPAAGESASKGSGSDSAAGTARPAPPPKPADAG